MANDNDAHPEKITFQRSEPEHEKISFKREADLSPTITNPDGSPLRDKDNAQPTLKPDFTNRPAPNLAPGGASGLRTGSGTKTPASDQAFEIVFIPEFEQDSLAYDHGIEFDSTLHTEGRVLDMPGYDFIARVNDEPNREGIDGGKIDQLVLKKDGATVACYNQGWEVDPKTAEHKEALHRIRTRLDDTPAKRITGPDQSKDPDIER